jgi:hypothetical protein
MATAILEAARDTAGQQMADRDVGRPRRDKAEISVTKAGGNDFASNESYQMVNLLRRLHVSEQKPEPLSSDLSAGSINAGPPASSRLDPAPQESTSKEPTSQPEEPFGLRLFSIASPKLAPEPSGSAEAAKEASKVDAAKTVAPRPSRESMIMSEAPKGAPKEAEAAKSGASRPTRESTIISEAAKAAPKEAEAAKTAAPRTTRESTITSLSADGVYDETWSDDSGEAAVSDQDVQTSGRRRLVALAAVIALAAVSGAIGGALATAAIGRHLEQSSGGSETRTAGVPSQAVEESIARIDAELAALKELGAAQSAKVNDRIEKVEKTQAEPTAKLARLNETLEKLRAAQASAPVAAVAAPKETTGSIQPPAAAPKPEVNRQSTVARQPTVDRLPTVESWVLRDVANGGALIEGRQGMFEVFAGDAVPGLGRVDAVRRQDGRWVVVTTKGLIVAR